MNIFSKLFGWIANLFRSDRLKWIRSLLPLAVPIAEALSGRDWNGDGVVEDARKELGVIVELLPTEITQRIFNEYVNADGSPKWETIGLLPVRHLKKILAIAQVVLSLVRRDVAVPSYGILDTLLQFAYEKLQK